MIELVITRGCSSVPRPTFSIQAPLSSTIDIAASLQLLFLTFELSEQLVNDGKLIVLSQTVQMLNFFPCRLEQNIYLLKVCTRCICTMQVTVNWMTTQQCHYSVVEYYWCVPTKGKCEVWSVWLQGWSLPFTRFDRPLTLNWRGVVSFYIYLIYGIYAVFGGSQGRFLDPGKWSRQKSQSRSLNPGNGSEWEWPPLEVALQCKHAF